jgi:hypothetical protein
MFSLRTVKTSSSDRRAKTDPPRRLAGVAAAISLAGCGSPAKAPAAAIPGAPEHAIGASASAAAANVEFSFDSLDDRPVSSDSTRGLPTLLAFVTTASLTAQAQVDFLVAMAKHDADRVHYAVVAVESPENREMVGLYGKALSIPFPVAMADAQTLGGAGPFGDVRAVPVTVLLDRGGRLVWRVAGRVAKSDELRAAMRGL